MLQISGMDIHLYKYFNSDLFAVHAALVVGRLAHDNCCLSDKNNDFKDNYGLACRLQVDRTGLLMRFL